MSKARRIADIVLDEESVARRSPEVEHERAVALFDLLEENDFALVGASPAPIACGSASPSSAWSSTCAIRTIASCATSCCR